MGARNNPVILDDVVKTAAKTLGITEDVAVAAFQKLAGHKNLGISKDAVKEAAIKMGITRNDLKAAIKRTGDTEKVFTPMQKTGLKLLGVSPDKLAAGDKREAIRLMKKLATKLK